MSWISTIFGKSNNNGVAINGSDASDGINGDNINVLEGLFVNNQDPSQITETVADSSESLKHYLEQDFFRTGYEDGYNGHSTELLENKIRSMKADFRYNLNLKIDRYRQETLKCENHKINIEGMSDRLYRQIDNQINAIKVNETELEAEIALATIDQGFVMVGIHQYRDGFIRGTEAYQQEKLIAGNIGLFV